MSYRIRQAQPDDAGQILAHLRIVADEPNNGISLSSSSELTQTTKSRAEVIRDALDSEDKMIFVAEVDDDIIGVLHCSNKPGGYAHTYSLGITVRKQWRDQGIGTALLQNLMKWGQQNPKCHRLELQVFSDNPRAIHVYRKLGFIHEGIRKDAFYKDNKFLDLVYMAIIFND